jgi:hypothetical protein
VNGKAKDLIVKHVILIISKEFILLKSPTTKLVTFSTPEELFAEISGMLILHEVV